MQVIPTISLKLVERLQWNLVSQRKLCDQVYGSIENSGVLGVIPMRKIIGGLSADTYDNRAPRRVCTSNAIVWNALECLSLIDYIVARMKSRVTVMPGVSQTECRSLFGCRVR